MIPISLSLNATPPRFFLYPSPRLHLLLLLASPQHKLAEKGEGFLNTLYCARSLAKAIPQAKNDQANRDQLYHKSIEVLKPVVDTMSAFLQYHKVGSTCTALLAKKIRSAHFFGTSHSAHPLCRRRASAWCRRCSARWKSTSRAKSPSS